MIKIFEDYLPDKEYKHIYETVDDLKFMWRRSNILRDPDDPKVKDNNEPPFCGNPLYNIQMCRTVYSVVSGTEEKSLILGCCAPLFQKLKITKKNLISSKFNLTLNHGEETLSGFHVDNKLEGGLTGIYYITTDNGYTLFEDGTKVSTVANKLVIFSNNTRHAGVSCTDTKYRMVLNINWHPSKNVETSKGKWS